MKMGHQMGGPFPFFIFLLMFIYLPSLPLSHAQGTFAPKNVFLINCGSSTNTTVDGRTFLADPTDSSFLSSSARSVAASTSPHGTVVSPVLTTARIFPNSSSYTFPVSPARFWIRLYFYPFSFNAYDLNTAVFSVVANGFTLLSNVHVTSSMQNSNSLYLFKEYSVNVSATTLTITFEPSMGSYAFINALEVVSMPSDILVDNSSPLGMNSPQPLGLESTAAECMYRINVGGPAVTPSNDSAGLFRTWAANETNLFATAGVMNVSTSRNAIVYEPPLPTYIAPPVVYSTALQMEDNQMPVNSFNISWVFSVDPEFVYIVRLHLCEIVVSTSGERIFEIYLQNKTAYHSLDLVYVKGAAHAYYRDFTVNSSGGISTLWIQIGPTPNAATSGNNAILNGIEIWKLNNTAGSLDGAIIVPSSGKGSSGSKTAPIIGGACAGVVAMVLIIVGLLVCCRKKSKVYKHSPSAWLPLPVHGGNSASMASKVSTVSHKSGTGSYVSSAPSSLGRQFSFAEILEATNSFDEAQVLGVGGFGKVYKGLTDDGTKVAVKRGNPRSEQGITEFQTEIDMLSKLRHRHLVSLIGYCDENCEMILVYEYMANGPLRSHLYGTDLPPFSWRQRLDICIGAARGLHYLHTGAAQGIIHRDVKTTNILLDENLVAKVSDFGLSKTGPTLDRTHVSTAVKGSFGYLDPEYFRRQQLTEKSDVYSFGVVLMEVLCARPAINPALPRDQVNIAEWAIHWQKMGLLDQIVDPHLAGTINTNSLRKYGETAEKCLAEQGIDRPAMGDVLWNLEYALQLQETAMAGVMDEDSRNQILELPIRLPAQEHWDTSGAVGHSMNSMASEEDSEDATASALFSQLVNPQGR
ncbi:hypothetical protein L7F22_063153 [Adiantum nelumboides]|nr:hypothetical protein [Adiantum nelumboides]